MLSDYRERLTVRKADVGAESTDPADYPGFREPERLKGPIIRMHKTVRDANSFHLPLHNC